MARSTANCRAQSSCGGWRAAALVPASTGCGSTSSTTACTQSQELVLTEAMPHGALHTTLATLAYRSVTPVCRLFGLPRLGGKSLEPYDDVRELPAQRLHGGALLLEFVVRFRKLTRVD
jgi:hypothetical protein